MTEVIINAILYDFEAHLLPAHFICQVAKHVLWAYLGDLQGCNSLSPVSLDKQIQHYSACNGNLLSSELDQKNPKE